MKYGRTWQKSGGLCWYCGEKLQWKTEAGPGWQPMRYVADHFVPKTKGGRRGDNLVPACMACNQSKSNCDIEEFRHRVANRIRGITFSHKQIAYLEEHGLKLPPIEVVFWFERQKK